MTRVWRRSFRATWLLLVFCVCGCAAGYSRYMGGALGALGDRDYESALARLEKPDSKTNKVLYRLERGLILHYQGQYESSNVEFEKAERLIDELYTRSASREVASLITNDAMRAYRGEEFERVFIHYYRAMNYQHLGQPQEALVECRKANLMLEDHAQRGEYELSYRNDAFMQYMTGLLYEAEGEWNDAYISYKDALKGYQAYGKEFGLAMPVQLPRDVARVARQLGYQEDLQEYLNSYGLTESVLAPDLGGEVIAFAECGFIARKQQYEIQLPILKGDDTGPMWVVSDRLVYRYYNPHVYRRASVSYWLRVAVPEYRPVPVQAQRVRISGGGQSVVGVPVEDLNGIALRTFEDKRDIILARTAARALAKYLAARGVEKAFEEDQDEKDVTDDERLLREGLGRLLGGLVNLFGAATEAADTRGWLALPARIDMARLSLPPGTFDLTIEFLDGGGRVIDVQTIPGVVVANGRPVFVNCRGYR